MYLEDYSMNFKKKKLPTSNVIGSFGKECLNFFFSSFTSIGKIVFQKKYEFQLNIYSI